MNSDPIFTTSWNDASELDSSYTRLSVPALLSAFFGAGAFFVYLSHWCFFFGVIAIVLSLLALWSIRSADGIQMGTSLAYFGLCSATFALVSISVFWAAYQYGVRQEADQFFRFWFAAVQQGNIPQAKEYRSIYPSRSRIAHAEEWWQKQYAEKYAHRAVHLYVEDKLIRVLMALGDKAKITYYKTTWVNSGRESDSVIMVYAVSFPAESGEIQTFFVSMSGKRSYPKDSQDFKAAGWNIEGSPKFYLPDEFSK